MQTLAAVSLAATCATLAATPATAQRVGSPPPELDAVKWYNTPPLTLGDLKGKAVLVEVFRTW
jgi:hypothetical protein